MNACLRPACLGDILDPDDAQPLYEEQTEDGMAYLEDLYVHEARKRGYGIVVNQ